MKRIEGLIDPFVPFNETETPPTGVPGFAWYYLKPVRFWLGMLLISAIAVGGIESSLYLLIGWFVDLLAHSSPDRLWLDHGSALISVALLVLVARPVSQLINAVISDQIIVPQLTTMIRWRTHVYTLGHALGYFQADFAGRLANRITQAGASIREIATTMLDTVVYVGIFAIAALGLFGSISLWLTLPVASWILLYAALMWYFVPRAQKRSLANAESRSVTVGRIVDSYTNILTVKLFARGEEERSAVRGALATWMSTFLDTLRLITGVTGVLSLLNSALLTATAGLSIMLWSRGRMTSGDTAAGLALVMRLIAMSGWVMQTVRGLYENIGVVQESMATIARPHALVDQPGATELVVRSGEIRFDHVSFHYGRESGIIDDLNLTIRPGERVGLVGASGAGKTTLTSLLLRLHDLESGRILIDGQDIARATQDSLRRQIGVVTQDTSLLHRSIGENIAYGRPGSTEAEIAEAARLAQSDVFIAELEDNKGRRGYDAHVGERGVKLSGGQRQRIAIARVMLKDAPILILDEATSALDSEIEAAIQDSLDTLMQGKTVLAIAHRLSTIAALDRLIVLERGRIVEDGSHAQLLASGGLYARLWQRQSGGFLGDHAAEATAEAAE